MNVFKVRYIPTGRFVAKDSSIVIGSPNNDIQGVARSSSVGKTWANSFSAHQRLREIAVRLGFYYDRFGVWTEKEALLLFVHGKFEVVTFELVETEVWPKREA